MSQVRDYSRSVLECESERRRLLLLMVLDRMFRLVYRVKRMDLSDLVSACSMEYDLILPLQGTDLYIVKGRERKPCFVYVSDLSTFVYCRRKFYLSYSMHKVLDRVRHGKIRQLLRRYRTLLEDGACIMDRESLRRVLAGQYIHRSIRNGISFTMLEQEGIRVEVEIIDLDMGLIGHIDILEQTSEDTANIYEVKTGLYRQIPLHYKVQVLAYKYLTEKDLGLRVEHTYIAYPSKEGKYIHEVRQEDEKIDVVQLLREARRTLLENKIPRPPEDLRKCEKCGFRKVCLYID